MKLIRTLSIGFLCTIYGVYAKTVISGNSLLQEETTSFAIGHLRYSSKKQVLFVAADASITNSDGANEYSIAMKANNSTSLIGLTPETTTLNITLPNQPNPLFNQAIAYFELLNTKMNETLPAVITVAVPNRIYLFESITNNQSSLLVSEIIKDASGNNAGSLKEIAQDNDGRLFSFSIPEVGSFGDIGTGIALIIRGFETTTGNSTRIFKQLDSKTGSLENVQSIALDVTSDVINIGQISVASFGQNPRMIWNDSLQSLIIGLEVTNPLLGSNGARTACIALLVNNKIALKPIAPATAFDNVHQTPFAVFGANQKKGIYDIATLNTSTGFVYCLVSSGDVTNPSVYAYPLVNGVNVENIGMLASKTSAIQDIFVTGVGEIPFIVSRAMIDVAQTPDDLFETTDVPVQVGNTSSLPGPIARMIPAGDAVVVSVVDAINPGHNGLYISQALFDGQGRIIAWTDWKRYAYATDALVNAAINTNNAIIYALKNNASARATIVTQTDWASGNLGKSLSEKISEMVTQNGELNYGTLYGSANASIANIEIGIFAGKNWLSLVQLGQKEDAFLIPNIATRDFVNAENLPHVEVVTTSAIASDTVNDRAWICVGGTKGISFLHGANNGFLWTPSTGIEGQFSNFPSSFSWTDFALRDVRALVCDENVLYIATARAVFRVDLTTLDLVNNVIPINRLFELSRVGVSQNAVIHDLIISGEYALLATSEGLYQLAKNQSIVQDEELVWNKIALPEGFDNTYELFAVTKTGNITDLARFDGGNVYILNGNFGTDQSVLHRAYIAPIAGGVTSNVQTTLLPDIRIEKYPTQFLNFGTSVNHYYADGTSRLLSRDINGEVASSVLLVAPGIQITIGAPFLGMKTAPIVPSSQLGNNIQSIVFSEGLGATIICQSMGLFLNE